jgi:hypothetical protein
LATCLFRMTAYVIKKLPVPTKRVTVLLLKVKSCKALLRTLLLWIRSYLQSVLRRKFLILDIFHPDTPYVRQQGCEDPWLFFKEKGAC